MLFETKDEIRNIFRQKRANISDKDRKSFSREIVNNFYANISLKPRSIIAAYLPLGSEVDISLLMEMYTEAGHTLCLPCVDEKNAPMVFRKYVRGTKMVRNTLTNTLEPPENFEEVTPNLVITPLVAFDSAGTRLGQGGGYYDRTFEYLTQISADFIAVGVAYSAQQTQFIRREPTDFKMDSIVTEKKVFIF